jgi:hypothetical protein
MFYFPGHLLCLGADAGVGAVGPVAEESRSHNGES